VVGGHSHVRFRPFKKAGQVSDIIHRKRPKGGWFFCWFSSSIFRISL
jgi:hypothetical protein